MRLMIIGALEGQLSQATKLAMDGGAKVAHADTIEVAMASLRAGRGADLLLADVMADIAGLLAALEAERIHIPVVACGTETNAAAAVNAIRAGAKEYIPLPPDAELIAAIISAVARESSDFLYRDPSMAKLVKLADQIAPSEASILITGESGSGKEVIAKYVHARSKRASKPFISINCAAIPENLLESELFGHEKGAFTGAVARRIGKFEEANGGTLLLDEISEMDIRLQAKLLRAIQERIIDRVGGTKPVPVDIRILATSNRDLDESVKEGHFREDLLFRLNVVNLKIPALRERPGDIIALAEHFIKKYAVANGVPERPLAEDARQQLVKAQWPGNVRELENLIHRIVAVHPQEVVSADIVDQELIDVNVAGKDAQLGGDFGEGRCFFIDDLVWVDEVSAGQRGFTVVDQSFRVHLRKWQHGEHRVTVDDFFNNALKQGVVAKLFSFSAKQWHV